MKPRAVAAALISLVAAGELLVAPPPPVSANPFAVLGAIKAVRAVTGGGGNRRKPNRNAARDNGRRDGNRRDRRGGGIDQDAYRQGYRDALEDARGRYLAASDVGEDEESEGRSGNRREGRGRPGRRNR